MALFNFKKEKKPKVAKPTGVKKLAVSRASETSAGDNSALYAGVLVRPRVTEKAADLSEKGVYVFDIDRSASKKSVTNAIRAFYNVTPERVHVATIKEKKVFVRGKWGTKQGGKKAYVYLKEGEKLEIM